MTISSLPDELIFDILSRVPAETALACNVVCSSWHRIINTTRFTKAHFNRAMSVIWGKFSNRRAPVKSVFFFIDDSKLNPVFKLRSKDSKFKRHLHLPCVIASCNGLVILEYALGDRYYSICNPVTREEVKIRKHGNQVIRGFYFHELQKEYKLLIQTSSLMNEYFVYGLSTKNTRPLQISGNFDFHSFGIVISGALFWTTTRYLFDNYKPVKNYEIRMFNCYTEEFEEYVTEPHPASKYKNEGPIDVKLLEIEGNLGFCYIYSTAVHVWILEDIGSCTWDRKYVVNLDRLINDDGDQRTCHAKISVVGIQNKNMLLFKHDVGLLWCNLRENNIRKIPTKKSKYDKYDDIYGIQYASSLVSLKKSNIFGPFRL